MERGRKLKKIIGSNFTSPFMAGILMTASLVNPAETHTVDLADQPTTISEAANLRLIQSNYLSLHFVETVKAAEKTQKDPELLKLETYLSSLRVDEDRLKLIVAKNDIFSDFKYFSEAERIDDFNRYYPIYKAVEEKFNVPWLLLWIMHAAETTVSRDKNSEQGDSYGAMQVNRGNRGLENPAAGREFLSLLPNQRYIDDCEEIFRGGFYIRKIADNIKRSQLNITDEEAVLNVVRYDYSAVQHGKARVNQYLRMKTLFD
jgi:hypothetical protein